MESPELQHEHVVALFETAFSCPALDALRNGWEISRTSLGSTSTDITTRKADIRTENIKKGADTMSFALISVLMDEK